MDHAVARGTHEARRMGRPFVLVHGSWHGGWAWDAVIRHLAGRGHRAHAPTLPGHGPGAVRLGITHRDCVDAVVAYIQEHELKDITLVGHSFGGSVIQKVAEQLSARIRRLVFLDALILGDNQCVFDNVPPEYVSAFTALAAASAAVGDDVEQEAADEFVSVKGHDLHAIAIGVVSPAEANVAAFRRDQPVVREATRWV